MFEAQAGFDKGLPEFGQHRPEQPDLQHTLADSWPNLVGIAPKLLEDRQKQVGVGTVGPESDRLGAVSAKIAPVRANVGAMPTGYGPTLPKR